MNPVKPDRAPSPPLSEIAESLVAIARDSNTSLFLRSNRHQLNDRIRTIKHMSTLLSTKNVDLENLNDLIGPKLENEHQQLFWSLISFQLEIIYKIEQQQLSEKVQKDEEEDEEEEGHVEEKPEGSGDTHDETEGG